MFRYLVASAAVCFSLTVRAQSRGEEINVVIFAPKNEVEKSSVSLPLCNEPEVSAAVAARIEEYQKSHPAASIVSRRKQRLLVKSLKAFVEVPVADFDNASNYEVAKELVMTKINYRIPEEDMRLCRGGGSRNIYLLMYPEGSGVRVQILNFVSSRPDGNDFSIYYVPASQGRPDKDIENKDAGSENDDRQQETENQQHVKESENLSDVGEAESLQNPEGRNKAEE